MISDMADAGLGLSGFFASPVTGRACTTNNPFSSSSLRARAHSMSWREPK